MTSTLRLRLLLTIWLMLAAGAAVADGPGRASPSLTFATIEQGRAVLTRRDDFVQRMSAFDRSARVGRDGPVTPDEYLAFVAGNVRAWPDDERAAVETAYATLRPALDALALPWPATILVVHTTDDEEAGAAYTRDNAIMLPPAVLAPMARAALPRTLAHELFHVLTRANPSLKARAYAAIGFVSCGEIALPSALRERRITNPDAPRNDHCIEVEVDGARTDAVPVIYALTPYDAGGRKPFFAYLEMRMLLVERSMAAQATYDDANARLVPLREAKGFYEQVGRNTRYVIHPEEILADNFAIIATHTRDSASPDVLNRIEAALRATPR